MKTITIEGNEVSEGDWIFIPDNIAEGGEGKNGIARITKIEKRKNIKSNYAICFDKCFNHCSGTDHWFVTPTNWGDYSFKHKPLVAKTKRELIQKIVLEEL